MYMYNTVKDIHFTCTYLYFHCDYLKTHVLYILRNCFSVADEIVSYYMYSIFQRILSFL